MFSYDKNTYFNKLLVTLLVLLTKINVEYMLKNFENFKTQIYRVYDIN